MKWIRALVLCLILLLLPIIPAQAAGLITFIAPLDGATVQRSVELEFTAPVSLDAYGVRVMYAPGLNATNRFMPSYLLLQSEVRSGTYVVRWNANDLNGGPYTLHLQFLDMKTGMIVAEGVRNVVLDAQAYTLPVSIDVPDTISGSATITGDVTLPRTVQGFVVAGWVLEYASREGTWHGLITGAQSGSLQARWDTAGLPDGPYTVRLRAWDTFMQYGTQVVRQVQVHNPPPQVKLKPQTLETLVTPLSLSYTAAAPVEVQVALLSAGTAVPVAEGTAQGDAGSDVSLAVPLDLRGLKPGAYTAQVQVKDRAVRAGTLSVPVTVIASVPSPTLAELPAYVGHRVDLTWTQAPGVAIDHFDVMRNGPDGQVKVGQVDPSQALTCTDSPSLAGDYTYEIVAVATDGRRAFSGGRQVKFAPPVLGDVSVSAVDGLGLQLQWASAEDPVGIAGYEVLLEDTDTPQVLAQLPTEVHAFHVALPPGFHRAALVAIDQVGNQTDSGPLLFRVTPTAVALLSHGHFAQSTISGQIEQGITWVPLRFFADTLGDQVSWDGKSQSALILDPGSGRLIVAVVGRAQLQVQEAGTTHTLDLPAAPRNVGGRVLVPLRALAEVLGAQVQWHGETQTVEIVATPGAKP